MSGSAGGGLSVLGWPAFANRAEQPYNALLYRHVQELGVAVREYTAARALSGRYALLHMHWPDRRVRDASAASALARSAALIALLDAVRIRGMRSMWTVHNLEAHEGTHHPWLEPRYWDAFTRRLDGFISPSRAAVPLIRERFPRLRDTPAFVVPLTHYRGAYPDDTTRGEARAALGIPEASRVACFIGQIRPYKNVPHLARAFRGVGDEEAVLLIAGRTKPDELSREIAGAAAGDPRIRFHPGFLPDDHIQRWLRAADLVVLPYREILNSGSALLALSFDRPVLVPDRGPLRELKEELGGEWVRTFDGELSPKELGDALVWATASERAPRAPLESFEPRTVAGLTVAAYRAVAG